MAVTGIQNPPPNQQPESLIKKMGSRYDVDVAIYDAIDNLKSAYLEVISPNASDGQLYGVSGVAIVINGFGFTGTTEVVFGSTPAAAFTVNSDNSIVTTPPSGSGTVSISVTNAYGTDTSDTFTYVVLPVVGNGGSRIGGALSNPITYPGQTITMSGSGFTGATSVSIGYTPVSFTVNSDTQITLAIPANIGQGTMDITVTNAAGTSVTNNMDMVQIQ